MIHDSPQPTATRQGMACIDAVFDGRTRLEAVEAVRVHDLTALPELLPNRAVIPVVIWDFLELLGVLAPQVLVAARMRKRAQPEVQRGLAPLTIGVAPNFVAGETTDLAVETSWGPDLGAVLARGATRSPAGEPRPIAGHGRDRYVYARAMGCSPQHDGSGTACEQAR